MYSAVFLHTANHLAQGSWEQRDITLGGKTKE